ncbi:MAG: hypothetical protein DMF61_18160 [Blastocatellia bacterium AA13]|nr:MAG: hypothetical protein DMF61_18160 [Blastocatellia bacterium AA13]
MATAIQKYFVSPRVPRVAAGFSGDSFVVADLRRGRAGFQIASTAATPLPVSMLAPSFESANIQDHEGLRQLIRQTAEAAGLSSQRRWSVALPETAARTLILALESKPAGRRELEEVIGWKVERAIAAPSSELRLSRQRMSPAGGQERYLVTVSRESVISDYEILLEEIGWKAGLVLPRHLAESQWLTWDSTPGDKMLVSVSNTGFDSMIVRGGEPLLVRSNVCTPDAIADELFRVALYYKEKIIGEEISAHSLSGVLIIGSLDRQEALRAISDATSSQPQLIEPDTFGIDLRGESIAFDQIAAAGGLATMAWQ